MWEINVVMKMKTKDSISLGFYLIRGKLQLSQNSVNILYTVKHITSEIAPFITLTSSDHIHTSKDDLVQYASYNCHFMSP